MSAMGILFLVSAAIILARNIVLYSIDPFLGAFDDPVRKFLANFVNGEITNEKFALAMIAGGGFLLFWGFFKKKEDFGPPDEYERRRLR